MHRRQLLAASLPMVVAGCYSSPSTETTEEPVTIGELQMINSHEEPHEIWVELLVEGETVFTTTRELPGLENNRADSVSIQRNWPDNVEQYTVRAELDGGDRRTTVFDKPHPNSCHLAAVQISPSGSYDIHYSTAGAETC